MDPARRTSAARRPAAAQPDARPSAPGADAPPGASEPASATPAAPVESPSGSRVPPPQEPGRQARRARRRALIRWQVDNLREGRPPNPPAGAIPRAAPGFDTPRAAHGEITATWIGHSTVLVQVGGLNVLTDPMWSERASPVAWAGPRRLSPPAVALAELPPIDVALVSHDHYDHLDARTVRALADRFGDGLVWAAPVGYRRWFGRLGVRGVVELGWWRSASLRTGHGELRLHALPARHWSQRNAFGGGHRSWASWALTAPSGGRVYFGGDSAYFGGYEQIGRALGPFDVTVLPIGAYEPRWFMAGAHMDPEEAVRAYRDLGGSGAFVGVHWGGFRLTDEDPLEPPVRTRAAWRAAGLDGSNLHVDTLGRTVRVRPAEASGR